MEHHNHINLDPVVRERLHKISPASIDRLLFDIRKKAKPYMRKRRGKKRVRKMIPVRTFADWHEPEPGFLEIDFVAHNGGSCEGIFIHTLVGTDINTGWTECIPLVAREQSLVVEGMEVLKKRLPFALLGLDSDNDSAFINDTLYNYCKSNAINFTRSRPFHKNDQAWVEQKNSAIVRRFVGYERFTGFIAGQALAQLYQHARYYVNFFQPSFKLISKERQGSKLRKSYKKPATPYSRIIENSSVEPEIKENLTHIKCQLDPVFLLHQIRDKQAALSALSSTEFSPDGPGKKDLEEFLAQLPKIWQYGDARPTHAKKEPKKRWWRSRMDPFEEVWPEVLLWLQMDPDATAKSLFERLQDEYPGKYYGGQLRTLQRRVKEWRQVMAKDLVYAFLNDESEYTEISPIGTR